ncbi:hypothetical protein HZH66_002413 [Vespula vulgaris]|uniref:Uncharacterized protein n=1 Tax=Vespula vulgaris TaxID=7454 RepID=A0A834KL44_VESVU|nr:hypothetical protein HZH66_002413 [Vespula vulgaris]
MKINEAEVGFDPRHIVLQILPIGLLNCVIKLFQGKDKLRPTEKLVQDILVAKTPRDAFYDDSRGMPAIPTRYPVRIKRVDLRSVQSYLNGGSS